jgi:AcrR family transcriptional regulator
LTVRRAAAYRSGMSADAPPRQEEILREATRLFAAQGYAGTTTRAIATAAGLNIATVHYHFGGKRAVYLAVMERAYVAERHALEQALAEVSTADARSSAASLHLLLDRYLDFCAEHPDIPALWMHRWLSDAEDVTGMERRFAQPLVALVTDAFAPAVAAGHFAAGADISYTLWSVVWCIHGFGRGGVLDVDGRRHGPADSEALERFRAHLHRMIALTLGAPPT